LVSNVTMENGNVFTKRLSRCRNKDFSHGRCRNRWIVRLMKNCARTIRRHARFIPYGVIWIHWWGISWSPEASEISSIITAGKSKSKNKQSFFHLTNPSVLDHLIYIWEMALRIPSMISASSRLEMDSLINWSSEVLLRKKISPGRFWLIVSLNFSGIRRYGELFFYNCGNFNPFFIK